MRPLLNEKESQVSWRICLSAMWIHSAPTVRILCSTAPKKPWRIGAQELKAAQSSHVSIMKMLRS